MSSQITVADYSIDNSIGKILGKGSFGIVYPGIQKSTGTEIAAKHIYLDLQKKMKQTEN